MFITRFFLLLFASSPASLHPAYMRLSQDSNWKLCSQHAHFLSSHSLSFGFLGFLIAFSSLSLLLRLHLLFQKILCLFFSTSNIRFEEWVSEWVRIVWNNWCNLYFIICLHKGLILLTNSFNFFKCRGHLKETKKRDKKLTAVKRERIFWHGLNLMIHYCSFLTSHSCVYLISYE